MGQNENPKLTKTVVCACKKVSHNVNPYSTWGLLDNIGGRFLAPYNSVISKGIDIKFGILKYLLIVFSRMLQNLCKLPK